MSAGVEVECDGLVATIVGTEGADELTGTDEADVIVGLGGNDVIVAGAGHDVVCGGIGDDKIVGGAAVTCCLAVRALTPSTGTMAGTGSRVAPAMTSEGWFGG